MDTNRYLKAVNIEWDVDLAEDLDSLPKQLIGFPSGEPSAPKQPLTQLLK